MAMCIWVCGWCLTWACQEPTPPGKVAAGKAPAPAKTQFERWVDELADSNRDTRREAAIGLYARNPNAAERPQAAEALAAAIWRTDDGLAIHYLRALHHWDPKRAGAEAARMIPDKSQFRRISVATFIESELPPALLEPLFEMLRDPTRAAEAPDTLAKFGAAAEKRALELLDDPDQQFVVRLVNLLRSIGTRKALPGLKKTHVRLHKQGLNHASEAIAAIIEREPLGKPGKKPAKKPTKKSAGG